jgi:eukaryotic-like serine/threonine-protein kinase
VFDGEGVMEVCIHHLNTPPVSLSERAAQAVPAALDAVLLRCLAKDPAQRPQSAAALLQSLADCGAPEWRDEDARAWWSRRREQQGSDAKRQRALALTPTLLEVDVGARAKLT